MKTFTIHKRKSIHFASFILFGSLFLFLFYKSIEALSYVSDDKTTTVITFAVICFLIELLLIRGIINLFIKKRIVISDEIIKYKNKSFKWSDIKDIAFVIAPNYDVNSITIESVPTIWLSKKPILVKEVEKIAKDDDYFVFGVSNQEFRKEFELLYKKKGFYPKIVRYNPN